MPTHLVSRRISISSRVSSATRCTCTNSTTQPFRISSRWICSLAWAGPAGNCLRRARRSRTGLRRLSNSARCGKACSPRRCARDKTPDTVAGSCAQNIRPHRVTRLTFTGRPKEHSPTNTATYLFEHATDKQFAFVTERSTHSQRIGRIVCLFRWLLRGARRFSFLRRPPMKGSSISFGAQPPAKHHEPLVDPNAFVPLSLPHDDESAASQDEADFHSNQDHPFE